MKKKKIFGFSLIELLVVVAIIGALAAIGTLSYSGYTSSAKKSAATNTMQTIGLMQAEYYSLTGSYYGSGCPPTDETVEGITQDLFDTTDDVIDSEHYLFCVVTDDSESYIVKACEGDKDGTACKSEATILELNAKGAKTNW